MLLLLLAMFFFAVVAVTVDDAGVPAATYVDA